jgi:hypothetical protein
LTLHLNTPNIEKYNPIMEFRSKYVEKTFLHEVSESDEEYEIVAKKTSL